MKRFFGVHILGLLFLTFSPTAQPANGAAAEPKRGGTVTLGITRDISVMNPLVDTSSTQKRIRDLMFEPLLGIDLKGYLQAGLAEAWASLLFSLTRECSVRVQATARSTIVRYGTMLRAVAHHAAAHPPRAFRDDHCLMISFRHAAISSCENRRWALFLHRDPRRPVERCSRPTHRRLAAVVSVGSAASPV